MNKMSYDANLLHPASLPAYYTSWQPTKSQDLGGDLRNLQSIVASSASESHRASNINERNSINRQVLICASLQSSLVSSRR